jgi:hypothetical protein
MKALQEKLSDFSIWGFAFGYFACYVPYSLMTKLLSEGLLGAQSGVSLKGLSILPVTALATWVAMLLVISGLGWWKYASHSMIGGLRVPHPTRWTFLSGIATALIIGTTTLAYTFEGLSIIFAMVLMRGGVLIIGPIVDRITGRHVRWFAYAGMFLALSALLLSLLDTDSYSVPLLAALVIALYLASYFVRFQFMSRLAKNPDPAVNKRYFVEEQMTATPTFVVILLLFTLLPGGAGEQVRLGFTMHWSEPYLWALILVGVFSQGTGVFGTLVLLDKSENTYSIPVNRSSSVLAGVLASLLLSTIWGLKAPPTSQLLGAALIVVAIFFLTIPPALARARRETPTPTT